VDSLGLFRATVAHGFGTTQMVRYRTGLPWFWR
jgi:hypothetical protein